MRPPTTRPRARRGLRGLAALAAVALLGAGCTDYGGDLSGAAGARAGGEDTVVVSDTAGTPLAFLAYGVRQGYFAAEGIEVEVRPSSGGATVIPSLMSGDVDIVGSNVVSAMIAMGRRMPVRMVAAGTSTAEEPEDDFSSLMVPPDSPIRDAADLAGARIAVNTLQNINDVVLYSALRERGVDLASVELVEMPLPDMAAAVQRGDVDAAALIEPFATIGRSQGLRDVLRPYSDLRPSLQIGTFLMTERTIEERPELAAAFQAGVRATAEAVRADPESFRAALPEISEVDPELAAEMDLPVWNGTTDRESIELIHAEMVEFGLTEAELDYEGSVLG